MVLGGSKLERVEESVYPNGWIVCRREMGAESACLFRLLTFNMAIDIELRIIRFLVQGKIWKYNTLHLYRPFRELSLLRAQGER